MNRRSFSAALVAGAAASVLSSRGNAQQASSARNVVLVHGAYADGSCWSEVIASRTTQAAWKSKPTWYAVSTNDRTTSPDLERFLAKRMHAKTIELESSHLSLISHPDQITNLILDAAGKFRQ
jgi:pimeloyl-ACP methyl ester carboxylesterase